MNTARLGKNIQNYIFSRGLSVAIFADSFGVNRRTVYKWFHGKSVPSLEMMIRISKRLCVSLDDLTEGV